MSLKKIVESAIKQDALSLEEAFKEEMASRVAAALEEKYKKAKCEEEDEDEKEEDEEESEEDEEESEDEEDEDED